MNLEERTRRGREAYEYARFQFIVTELELALTFGSLALSSGDSDAKQRNMKHARQAYKAAMERFDGQTMAPRRKRTVLNRISRVKKLFKKLPARGRQITFK